MVQYCKNCGHELEDNAKFCDSCGFEVNSDDINKETNVTSKTQSSEVKNSKNESINKLPLILSIIAIIVAICEVLGMPVFYGLEYSMVAMGFAIVGGLIGIFLFTKMNEPLIAAIEFIVTGILVFMLISRYGEISTILFIVSGILTLFIKGTDISNKKLWTIPILTFVLVFVLLVAAGAFHQSNSEKSVTVGNITQNITHDGSDYYDGYVSGDIRVDNSFDYLEVTIDFYDDQNKIIDSTIAWNELNVNGGKTYKFEGNYIDKKRPSMAEIKVVDSSDSTTPLYTENITLSISGV